MKKDALVVATGFSFFPQGNYKQHKQVPSFLYSECHICSFQYRENDSIDPSPAYIINVYKKDKKLFSATKTMPVKINVALTGLYRNGLPGAGFRKRQREKKGLKYKL